MASEFELIRRYFTRPVRQTRRGIGDDCARVAVQPGMELVVTSDMLIEGTHFLPDADPARLGHKTLAVNLSDLAAAGATPLWVTLAVALPSADEAWIAEFARGFFALAERFDVDLIGGDTTRGARAFCVTALGEVPAGLGLDRGGARPGDDIWVSGELGGAALALEARLGRVRLDPARVDFAAVAVLQARLEAPEPRVELGGRLRGLAGGAIDVSDGLAGDLDHVCKRSGVDALIEWSALPRPALLDALGNAQLAARCVLEGGDDYELAFTALPARRGEIEAIGAELGLALTRIGVITPPGSGTGAGARVRVRAADGTEISHAGRGYDHFAPRVL